MALPTKWENTVFIKFTAVVDTDMGWVTDAVIQCNGIVANWWVNVNGVAIHTDSAGTPIPV